MDSKDKTIETNSNKSTEVDRLMDEPISDRSGDKLGFVHLISAFISVIDEHPNTSGLVLGLDGSWGSGKSSILRLLRGALRARNAKQPKRSVDLVVVPFSPWLITNRTALITSFFSVLSKAIDEATQRAFPWWNPLTWHRKLKIRKLRKQLHDFSTILAIASKATVALDPTITSAALASGSSAIGEITSPPKKTLDEKKRDLEEQLRDLAKTYSNFKVLVIIDDLDRLDQQDAIEVLRLVKAVADFPAVAYLLAYDRNVLADAIKEHRNIADGHSYLEKILQFSFKVPPLEPFKLRQWLKAEIQELFPNQVNFESERAQAVLDIWAGRLLRTPRDVKRLLFAVRGIWKDLKSKVDLLDLIWLQMIKEKAASSSADLYGWVIRYLQSLDAVAIGGMIVGRSEDSAELGRILRALGWRVRESGNDGSDMDIHYLNKILAGITKSYLDESALSKKSWTHELSRNALQQFREEMRLSSPWHWRLYFALEPPSHAITDEEWAALVQAASKTTHDLQFAIQTLLQEGTSDRIDLGDQLLERLTHAANTRKLDSPRSWIIAIFSTFRQLRKCSKNYTPFGMDILADRLFHIMSKSIFSILGDDDRKEVIQYIFVEGNNLGLAAEMFRRQYALSKKASSETTERPYLYEKELEIALKGQLHQYNQLSTETFLQSSSPYDILYAWSEITESKSAPSEFLSKALNTDEGLFQTLNALKCVTSSEQKNIPHLPEGWLSPFVDIIALKARLKTFADSGGVYAAPARELLDHWWASR